MKLVIIGKWKSCGPFELCLDAETSLFELFFDRLERLAADSSILLLCWEEAPLLVAKLNLLFFSREFSTEFELPFPLLNLLEG